MAQEAQKAGENQGCREGQVCGIRREQEVQSSMQRKSRKIKAKALGAERHWGSPFLNFLSRNAYESFWQSIPDLPKAPSNPQRAAGSCSLPPSSLHTWHQFCREIDIFVLAVSMSTQINSIINPRVFFAFQKPRLTTVIPSAAAHSIT